MVQIHKIKCLVIEYGTDPVILFKGALWWEAHTAILHKRKLCKSFSYGSTPYTPTIPPIKKWVSGEIGTRNGNFYTHVFS